MTGGSIGVPYKQFRDLGPFDVIVIGSGIGGLATAAMLAKAAGQRVLVLERHYTAGGCTQVFHRPGFEWDVGVHYVGQVHDPTSAAHAMFEYLSEGRLEWRMMPDVYDRVIVNGMRFDYVRGESRLRDALTQAFPAETRAIDGYFQMIRRCGSALPLYYVEKTLPPALDRIIGVPLRAPFLHYARRTTSAVLQSLGASAELAAVLTAQWPDYGLPPEKSSFGMHAIVASHYFDGAAYPVGGASRIASSLMPTIERAGGAVVVNATVERILIENEAAVGVRMHDGREFRAWTVVSDAGVQGTLRRLLPDEAPAEARKLAARISNLQPSLAHLCLYVGLDSARLRTPLEGTNLWIHPGVDFDQNLSRFMRDEDAPFPFLFISFPSAKDPSFADRHPGHETIEVVTAAPFDRFAPWSTARWHRRGDDYDALKAEISNRLVNELYHHVPAVQGAIVTTELSTPVSTRYFLGNEHGETYGVAHSPARFESRDLRPQTPVRGLYLTGQDVGTGGVMGAISGAVATASAMLRRNLFSETSKAA
jgi:all-trans-retinol 13,14-reductase